MIQHLIQPVTNFRCQPSKRQGLTAHIWIIHTTTENFKTEYTATEQEQMSSIKYETTDMTGF